MSITRYVHPFRYAKHYYLPNKAEARDLVKAYGLLFIISVEGKAGQFSIIPLAFNIGAGLGLFGLVSSFLQPKPTRLFNFYFQAKILTDFVLLNFTAQKREYKQHKYTKIIADDFARMTRQVSRIPAGAANRKQRDANPVLKNQVQETKLDEMA